MRGQVELHCSEPEWSLWSAACRLRIDRPSKQAVEFEMFLVALGFLRGSNEDHTDGSYPSSGQAPNTAQQSGCGAAAALRPWSPDAVERSRFHAPCHTCKAGSCQDCGSCVLLVAKFCEAP